MPPVEQVILVDEQDRPHALLEKLQAHREGLLHRAVSGFLFSADGRLLLQQRAASKYHCAGLWANSCCSHPREGETTLACMQRRFVEELGIVEAALEPIGTTRYRCEVGGGMTEHELVHGFSGRFAGEPSLNPDEVQAWRWVALDELQAWRRAHPEQLAPWLRFYLDTGFAQRALARLAQA